MRALALTFVLALTLTASATATGSGLRGKVWRGPTQPVCQVDKPCEMPAKNVRLVFARNGVTRTVTSGADGRYAISLAAGTWTVRIPSAKLGARPRAVLVRAGVVRVVNFTIDTGIR